MYRGVRPGLQFSGRVFSRRFGSSSFKNSGASGNNLKRNWLSISAASVGIVGVGIYGLSLNNQWREQVVKLDSPSKGEKFLIPADVERIQPETKVPPFPKTFSSDGEAYELLGTGVRSVSFLSFHVYGLGIYIAQKDKSKVKKLLGSDVTYDDLMDPEKGGELVTKLLNGGIRFDIRIVPVRNTDFGHMRDGLVRTTMAHPRFKAEGNNEEFGEGLAELKKVFSRKMSVHKNKILHLNRDRDGVLSVTFFKADDEPEAKEPVHLGIVKMPLVSELLFLQYLSGKKPSSESARENSIKGLAELLK